MLPATIPSPRSVRLAGSFGNGLVTRRGSTISTFRSSTPSRRAWALAAAPPASLDFAQPADGAFPAPRRGSTSPASPAPASRPAPRRSIFLAGNLRPRAARPARSSPARRRSSAGPGPLQPLGPAAGTWRDRLLAAPLSGGVRYNGPPTCRCPSPTSPPPIDRPAGPRRRFHRPGAESALSDGVVAQQPALSTRPRGTRVTNLAVDGRFNGSELRINRLAGRAGNGTSPAAARSA